MRKPPAGLVLSIVILFVTGCVRVQVQPLPAPEARPALELRGVVLHAGGETDRIEFDRVDAVEWSDSTLILTGMLKPADDLTSSPGTVSRSFPLSSISGVLVRQLDVNSTSLIIAAVAVGTIATAALLLTGRADEGTVVRGVRD